MRRQITEAGNIHFFGLQRRAQCRLKREYRCHKRLSVIIGQIRELFDMRIPDDAAKTGIGDAIVTLHAHHAKFFAAKNYLAAVTIA